MTAWIHNIGTLVPETCYTQEHACRKMQSWTQDKRERRLIRAVYANSGIDKRHSVVSSFDGSDPGSFFARSEDGSIDEPGTQERNERFTQASKELAVKLARNTLDQTAGVSAADVTHVITASCTGFYNPGPDYHIVRELGIPYSVERYHLGFMGCYAAVPALRMAARFCAADPQAVVLVLCVELCSLHMQLNRGTDFLLANSLFADGAGAVIVSARQPAEPGTAFALDGFACTLLPEGEHDMAWTIGDHGFEIRLSSYVPRIISENVKSAVSEGLASCSLSVGDIGTWAVHPGGKAIVDKVGEALELQEQQVAASRHVLREYGNMSSATLLFVLEHIFRTHDHTDNDSAHVCAMAFGPGLTVEMALLRSGLASD